MRRPVPSQPDETQRMDLIDAAVTGRKRGRQPGAAAAHDERVDSEPPAPETCPAQSPAAGAGADEDVVILGDAAAPASADVAGRKRRRKPAAGGVVVFGNAGAGVDPKDDVFLGAGGGPKPAPAAKRKRQRQPARGRARTRATPLARDRNTLDCGGDRPAVALREELKEAAHDVAGPYGQVSMQ